MRIAILGDALDVQYAGIHVYLKGLLHALTSVDRENEYLVVRPEPGGEFDGMEERIVPVRNIPGHQRWRTFHAIPRMLRHEKVDVVVEPAHFGPFGLPGRIKRVTVIHDLTPVLFPHFHPFPSGWIHKFLLPGVLARADLIIANSDCTRRDIVDRYHVPHEKISMVRPGREAIFKPRQDGTVLERYGIRRPYLLSVGTIEPRKNLTTLLKAYNGFREASGQEVQLVLAGKPGWKNGAFFNELQRSPFRSDIVLTGYTERSDLPVLYSMADLFIYPSWYEGFGLPVLEAMACGIPVLVSGTSSLPEVAGNAAVYFSPEDAPGLCTRMLELFRDTTRRKEMAAASLERVLMFDWNTAARAFMDAIRKL